MDRAHAYQLKLLRSYKAENFLSLNTFQNN